MPIFNYKARDQQGMERQGTVEAMDQKGALEVLQEKYHFAVVSLTPYSEFKIINRLLNIINRISKKDVVVFSRQLSSMSNAGLPLVDALNILSEETENKRFQDIIFKIAKKVEGGSVLSEALAGYPQLFSRFFVNMVKSGETTGKIAENLNYLADQLEKDYSLRREIQGAMMYPIFIIVGIVVVMAVMVIFVMPQLTSILKESGADLPIYTKVLISITDFASSYWWLLLIVALLLGGGLYYYVYRTPAGRRRLDNFKVKAPLIGRLMRNIYIARFARNLSLLMAGDIPIVRAIDLTAGIVANVVYHDILAKTAANVRGGKTIASSLRGHPTEFPSMISHMISIGEKAGKLEDLLNKVADYYENEVTSSVKGLVSLIEPLLMVFLGGAVLFIMLAVLLPIYNLTNSF